MDQPDQRGPETHLTNSGCSKKTAGQEKSPASGLDRQLCPLCHTPTHVGEGICLACGTRTSNPEATDAGVAPPTPPAPSKTKPRSSWRESGSETTENPQAICAGSLKRGPQSSDDLSSQRKSLLRSLRSSLLERDTSPTGTTGSTASATWKSWSGFEPTARRYLEGRHSVMWADWNLTDRLAFEEAVEWLAQVLAEAFAPVADLP